MWQWRVTAPTLADLYMLSACRETAAPQSALCMAHLTIQELRLLHHEFACAGSSSSAPVREQAGRAISALVKGQGLLAVQGSEARPHILMSACREAAACTLKEDTASPWDWDLDLLQRPIGSLPRPHINGQELLPDLTGLEALAEQLIFQASGQEYAEVRFPHRHHACCGSLINARLLKSRVLGVLVIV